MLLKALGIHLKEKLYGELFVFLWFGLFGKREMQESLKTKRDWKRRCGIYFTFTHLCGLIVPKPLVGFLFQFYFVIEQRFVSLSFSFGFVSFCTGARKSLISLVLSSTV